jgi:hypothetical protein
MPTQRYASVPGSAAEATCAVGQAGGDVRAKYGIDLAWSYLVGDS